MLYINKQSIEPFDFEGLRIRDFITKELKSASIAEIEVPPGVHHRAARSKRSDKFYFCLDGKVSFHVVNKVINLVPGDLLVVEREEWFSYFNEQETPSRLLLVHVPSFDLEQEEFREELPSTKAS